MDGGIHPSRSSAERQMKKSFKPGKVVSGQKKRFGKGRAVGERLYSEAKIREARKWNSKVA